MPNPPRTEVFPSLKGSQAKPTRGSKFLLVGFLRKYLLLQVLQFGVVGLVNRNGRVAIRPSLSVGMGSISKRKPKFRVRVERNFQSSWKYTAGVGSAT